MARMNFPERIKNLRLAQGLSQKEMAQKLFVSQQAVSRWETGASYPDVPTLKLIATTFNVTIDDLLSGDYIEAKKEKKIHHSPFFHVLLWAGAVLLSFATTLLILYFVSGSRFDHPLAIIQSVEIGLLSLAFIPALLHLYRKGTRKMILISLIVFGFFTAFSWGSFFMALAKSGLQDPSVWVTMGYALFLGATSVFLLLLYLRSQKRVPQPSAQPSYLKRVGKSIRIVAIVGVALSLIFAILTSAYTHAKVWGNKDFLSSILYLLSLIFLIGFGLLALSAVVLDFIESKKKGKSLQIPVLLSATLLVSVLLPTGFTIGEKSAYSNYYSYSAEKWLGYEGNDRYRMFPSFESDHQLVGASEITVYSWLGQPDETRSGENPKETGWYYDLGPDGLGIDEYVLRITFSESKIVTAYSVYDS